VSEVSRAGAAVHVKSFVAGDWHAEAMQEGARHRLGSRYSLGLQEVLAAI
jgi:hypothetical protein